jgi:hypothetical protein
MTEAVDLSIFPDAQLVLLPSRAYLTSMRDQTLPTRKAALADAHEHFHDAIAHEDHTYHDMALLGLIAEAMQILEEDVAYIGTAYERPLGGVAHYVTATVYSGKLPNTFYTSIKNWPDERIKVLASLWVRNRDTGEVMPMVDGFGFARTLDAEDRAALTAAEDATVKLLRPLLNQLGHAWQQFGSYHHAFKHGGLAISRDDFEILDEDGTKKNPSINVWLRRKDTETGKGDTKLTASQVAEQVWRTARHALRIARYLLDSRLRNFDALTFSAQGTIIDVKPSVVPWEFWVYGADITSEVHDRLERLGVHLQRPTDD